MKKNKLAKVIIMTTVLLATIVIQAFAQDYVLFGHKLSGGVGNHGSNTQMYFVDSTASAYTGAINAAMSAWNNTGTAISFTNTSAQQNSVIDVLATYNNTTPTLKDDNAWTLGIVGGSTVYMANQDWNWCKITINTFNCPTADTSPRNTTVVTHEMGHCFGLNENNTNQSCVMCQEAYGRTATAPSQGDINGINAINY